jgi:fucose permease
MATKTSILIFFLRMSRNTNRLFRVASYVTLAVVNIAGLVLTFLNIFQCTPIQHVFDPIGNKETCIPLITLYLVSSPVNIITDLVILVLPIPILTGMHLPQKQKTILVFTFCLGIFVTIVDVIRIYYLQQAMASVLLAGVSSPTITHGIGEETDFAYNAAYSLMWSAVEINVGIICACIPTMKPLIRRILPILIEHSGAHSEETIPKPDAVITLQTQGALPPIEGHIGIPASESHPNRTGSNNDQGAEMDMLDFLTAPGMEPNPSDVGGTGYVPNTSSVYFGFVNVKVPKSMLTTTAKESFKYCTAVTIIFFLWGFSYGLLNTLNFQIAAISNISAEQTLALQTAYFGAYFFGPLTVGRYVLVRFGFKATFIVGLCIYGTGTLIFWPSSVLVSFPGFVVSSFVAGFGLSILETAANPFLVLCGPPEYGEMRLLLAQGVQGIGAMISQLIADHAFFGSVNSKPTLIDVQWTYLAIDLFDVILALFFYYMPLPEAKDSDLHMASMPDFAPMNSTVQHPDPDTHFHRFRVVHVTLTLGVFAQFLYVGAQESISTWSDTLLSSLTPNNDNSTLALSITNWFLLGHAVFAISRFLAGGLCLFFRPRFLLLSAFLGCLIFAIIITALPNPAANTIGGMVIMVLFFEGPIFPLIFAISLRRMGVLTKTASALITAGALGGGLFPWAMYGAVVRGATQRQSYWVVVLIFALGLCFPLYLCVFGKAQEQVDWIGKDGRKGNGSRRDANVVGLRRRRLGRLVGWLGSGSSTMGQATHGSSGEGSSDVHLGRTQGMDVT